MTHLKIAPFLFDLPVVSLCEGGAFDTRKGPEDRVVIGSSVTKTKRKRNESKGRSVFPPMTHNPSSSLRNARPRNYFLILHPASDSRKASLAVFFIAPMFPLLRVFASFFARFRPLFASCVINNQFYRFSFNAIS